MIFIKRALMDDRALRATIGLSASEFNQLVHPDIFTLGTYLLLFLLCLTTDAPLTVKHIFEDNLNFTGRDFALRKKITSAMSKFSTTVCIYP